jgi:hypothetical protein
MKIKELKNNISQVYHDVLSSTNHGEKEIEPNKRRKVLHGLDILKPAIAEVVQSPPASAEHIAQFVVASLQGYHYEREDADRTIMDAELFIRQDVHPTESEMERAYRFLKIERKLWDGSPAVKAPTVQEIRKAVIDAKKDTHLVRAMIENIHRMMDGNRPFGVGFLVASDDDFLEALADAGAGRQALSFQEEEKEKEEETQ